jgi:hypothetical protein
MLVNSAINFGIDFLSWSNNKLEIKPMFLVKLIDLNMLLVVLNMIHYTCTAEISVKHIVLRTGCIFVSIMPEIIIKNESWQVITLIFEVL